LGTSKIANFIFRLKRKAQVELIPKATPHPSKMADVSATTKDLKDIGDVTQ
jgi:hypothetical protein